MAGAAAALRAAPAAAARAPAAARRAAAVAASAAASAASAAAGALGRGARMTEVAQAAWGRALGEGGAFAVDMTAGGGKDTLFLARAVGARGHVLGCDVQAVALSRTRVLLAAHAGEGLGAVRLREGCHSTLTLQEATERVGWGAAAPPRARPSLVCFNLGYLPGGDRAVKTAPETTVPAVRGALDMLGRGGLLSVLVYVGHQGGPQEREAVEATLSGLSPRNWSCSEVRMVNRQGCPVLYLAERMSEPDPEPGLG